MTVTPCLRAHCEFRLDHVRVPPRVPGMETEAEAGRCDRCDADIRATAGQCRDSTSGTALTVSKSFIRSQTLQVRPAYRVSKRCIRSQALQVRPSYRVWGFEIASSALRLSRSALLIGFRVLKRFIRSQVLQVRPYWV